MLFRGKLTRSICVFASPTTKAARNKKWGEKWGVVKSERLGTGACLEELCRRECGVPYRARAWITLGRATWYLALDGCVAPPAEVMRTRGEKESGGR